MSVARPQKHGVSEVKLDPDHCQDHLKGWPDNTRGTISDHTNSKSSVLRKSSEPFPQVNLEAPEG